MTLVTSTEAASDVDALAESAAEAMRARRYDEAARALTRLVELVPDDANNWLQLGIARAAGEDWEGATAAYERVIEIDPGHVKANHNLGNVYFRKGEFEPAARYYGRAMELDPDYLLGAFHLGWTLRQLGRAEEGEAAFRRCMEIPAQSARERQTHIDCLFGLGSLRHRDGDYESSSMMMEQVLRAQPAHVEARYYLGIAYRQLGRTAEAKKQLEIHARMLEARRNTTKTIENSVDP